VLDEEEEKEYRKLEVKYEDVYKEVYQMRDKILAGEIEIP